MKQMGISCINAIEESDRMKRKIFVVIMFMFTVTAVAEDFEYNTGGTIDMTPTTGGWAEGWGEWFITTLQNDTGYDLMLTEFGFPCCGPATGTYGWVVWTDIGGITSPSGDATTADYYDEFTPTDPGPSSWPDPPVIYSYVDVSEASIIIPDGNYFCFGYDVTDMGGQITYNEVETWAWFEAAWDSDADNGRTAILQVKADFEGALDQTTWGSIKNAF